MSASVMDESYHGMKRSYANSWFSWPPTYWCLKCHHFPPKLWHERRSWKMTTAREGKSLRDVSGEHVRVPLGEESMVSSSCVPLSDLYHTRTLQMIRGRRKGGADGRRQRDEKVHRKESKAEQLEPAIGFIPADLPLSPAWLNPSFFLERGNGRMKVKCEWEKQN